VRIETFLRQSPLFAVNRASRRLDGHLTRVLGSAGLTFPEALVLVSIFFEEPKAIKPSHLAETLSTTRGNVSHCISGLEAKSLVRRRIDPEDARSFQLLLKPQGTTLAMRVIGTLHEMQRDFEQRIGTADLQAALTVIQKVEQVCAALAGNRE
jgi:DNA-binding MarR family transcriptional regulator